MKKPWEVLNREGGSFGQFETETDARIWAIYYLRHHQDEHVFIACDRSYYDQHEAARRERGTVGDAFWTTERLLVLTHMEESLGRWAP